MFLISYFICLLFSSVSSYLKIIVTITKDIIVTVWTPWIKLKYKIVKEQPQR